MTYFLTYFEDLVLSGLYILRPRSIGSEPTTTVYAYNESSATMWCPDSKSVTRFKGLGEIDPWNLDNLSARYARSG